MKVTSTVIKYGDHVDTDVIIPARYLNTADPAELASHCMEDLYSDFKAKSRTSRSSLQAATLVADPPVSTPRLPLRQAALNW